MNRLYLRGWIILAVIAFASVGLGLWLRAVAAPEWLQPDTMQKPPVLRPWAVEADCYSQLARVQRILHGHGLIQNHFAVENWPEGLIPSTTAPFDYVILLLYAPLTLVTKFPLDWAGALVSPFLWLALVFFWMFFRSREFSLFGRGLFLVGSATLPAFIWAFSFGRPRHQSLILLLIAVGLTAEYERWHLELTAKRAWNILAGLAWGLACWTSLFEPAVVASFIIVFNLAMRRRENPAFLLSLGAVMTVAWLCGDIHVYIPPPQYRDFLVRWLESIREVQPVSFATFMGQMTLILLALPLMAWRLLVRIVDRRTDILLILLTLVLCVLTVYQRRWIYYASLAELFLIVRYCQAAPVRWWRLVIIGLFLIGVANSDYQQIHGMAAAPANQPSLQLAQTARAIDHDGGIMAPWWLSPGMLYFSGQPIVSGSSHCGISGIVDSARFFTSTNWIEAEQILRERRVRWVMVVDDSAYLYPMLNNGREILGLPAYTEDDKAEADLTVWQVLIEDRAVPRFLQLRSVTEQLRLYEYVPEEP